MDWLFAPIDASRDHVVGFAAAWHGRSMMLAWGILAPLAVIVARFFKVLPGQDWPRVLDTQLWWRSHWMGQAVVVGLSVFGFALVLPSDLAAMGLHNWLGYGLLAILLVQVVLGLCRGSKGGPSAPAPDGSLRGHHYDMTPRRRAFEALHKLLGYFALVLAAAVLLTGMWKANAPVWMWGTILAWWCFLGALFALFQRRGMAVDTYQAIWGPGSAHPGNRGPHPGWGMRRLGETDDNKGADDVRSDRGDGVRSH